jgi:hypothetical protein
MFCKIPRTAIVSGIFILSFALFGSPSAHAQTEEELLQSISFYTESYEAACKRIEDYKKEQAKLEAKKQAALAKRKPDIDAAKARGDAASKRQEEWQAIVDNPSSSETERDIAFQAVGKWRDEANAETRYIDRIEIPIREEFNEEIFEYNGRIGDEERDKRKYAKELEDLRYKLKNPNGGSIIAAKPDKDPKKKPGAPADVSPPIGDDPAGGNPFGENIKSILKNFQPFIEVGGGFNFPTSDRAFVNFNQGLDGDPGGFGLGHIGIKSLPGRYNNKFQYGLGVVVQHQQVKDSQLVNLNAPGTLPLGGRSKATSIFGRVSAERPLFTNTSNGGLRLLKWEVSAGAGAAFQKFSATNGGATVLNGKATTPMVNFTGGLNFPVNQNVDVGVHGYATWFDSYNVSAGATSSRFDETWNVGIFATLRIRLPGY